MDELQPSLKTSINVQQKGSDVVDVVCLFFFSVSFI